MRIGRLTLLAVLAAAALAIPGLSAAAPSDPPADPGAATSDIQVTNTADATTATPGDDIRYTLTVTNTGPADAQSVKLTDAVPAHTTFVSMSAVPGWTRTTPPAGATGTVTATTATLAAGASATFTLTVRTDADTPDPTPVSDTASVSTATSDPATSNNSASTTVWVGTKADVAVTVTAGADTVVRNTNLTYTVTLANNGVDASDVVLTNPVPSGASFVSARQTAGSQSFTVSTPSGRTGDIQFSIDKLRAGGSATFEIVVRVTASPGSIVQDTATVTTTTAQATTLNDSATAVTTIVAPRPMPPPGTIVDLRTAATARPAAVHHGYTVRLRFRVSNRGDLQAAKVRISARVPRGLTLVRVFSNSGECLRGRRIACDLATLIPGRTATVSARVRVTRRGRFSLRVRASSAHADAHPGDNLAVLRLRGR